MMIRAITFDLDDTLWPVDPVIERAERVMHLWLGEHYPEVVKKYTVEGLRQLRFQVAAEHPGLVHDLTAMRVESLKMAARQCGYPERMADEAFQVMWLARNEVAFFADVLPALEKLARHFVLGALTNGNADIKLVGLGHLFAFSVNAREVGVAKPDPEIFHEASRRAKIPLHQMLHIGDDPLVDVAGAKAVGMKTVYLKRAGARKSGEHDAHAELSSLGQLESLLISWGALDKSRSE